VLWYLILWGALLAGYVLAVWAWRAEKEARRNRERLRAWIQKEYGPEGFSSPSVPSFPKK
jgi:hypothetical protein